MKIVLITLVILLCLNQKVTCDPVFDALVEHFNNIAVSMTKTFSNIKYHVSKIFSPNPVVLPRPQLSPDNINYKRSLNAFVKKTTSENGTEISDYIKLKSEPTALMSTPQLAALHGRRVESHVINTKDGYLLTIHRLSPIWDSTLRKRTVILHHGLLGSSADWILLGPTKSLPYILADIGYDVWMANARGNYYSRGHIRMAVESEEFWRFSFQEIGEYDLASVIDYIRAFKKCNDSIDFVGHSMGATALLVLLSTTPRYNHYLRIGILLAPLAFMSNVDGPFKLLTTMASKPHDQLLKLVEKNEFVPSRQIPKWLATKYCKGPLLFCSNPLYFVTGGIPNDYVDWNLSFLARLIYHVPAGGSTDTMLHYAQVIKSGKFHRFNNANDHFPLNLVTLPIALFSSSDDWLATIPDILRLYFSISNPIDHYIIRGKNMSHTEFVWGYHAEELVFKKILEFLDPGININSGSKNNEIQNDLLFLSLR